MSSELTAANGESGPDPQTPGILFVVSSPSGGGKGTLINRVLEQAPNLAYSVSYTTRNPRPGEVEGREYFFLDQPAFEQMIKQNEFLEWACVHGKLYGTALNQVTKQIGEGRDIILEVDVQGAASVRKLIPDAVSIFILPPSFETLKQRLIDRGTDSREELDLRLRTAPEELKDYLEFDYVVVNDDAVRAASQLQAIIIAERSRLARQRKQVQQLVEAFVEAK